MRKLQAGLDSNRWDRRAQRSTVSLCTTADLVPPLRRMHSKNSRASRVLVARYRPRPSASSRSLAPRVALNRLRRLGLTSRTQEAEAQVADPKTRVEPEPTSRAQKPRGDEPTPAA